MNIICIGSTNPVKIRSLVETLRDYDFIKPFRVLSMNAQSGIPEQPTSLSETITGARNRAKSSFVDCQYGVGIESGLMRVPQTKTGFMDVCACAIYNGQNYSLGLSSAFEPPREMVRLVFERNMDLNTATHLMGLSNHEKIGKEEGVIGLLTKNRIDREGYTRQAIQMALIHLENPNLY